MKQIPMQSICQVRAVQDHRGEVWSAEQEATSAVYGAWKRLKYQKTNILSRITAIVDCQTRKMQFFGVIWRWPPQQAENMQLMQAIRDGAPLPHWTPEEAKLFFNAYMKYNSPKGVLWDKV